MGIFKRVEALEEKIYKKINHDNIVECSICGCLLFKHSCPKTAEICKGYWNDYIHYTYYCKVHAPKEKK